MIGNRTEVERWLLGQTEDKCFEIKECHDKRSLNANAYAWKLITMISDALRISKEECYLEMLKRYGQSEIVSVVSDTNVDGYFKYYEVIGSGEINDKEFTHYKVYKGSSEYDTKEMSVLIDGIISEAEEMGIETLPAEQIKRLKEQWQSERKSHSKNT